MLTGSGSGVGLGGGGYLSEKGAYGSVGVGGVYPSNYGCYYTNMDYLTPGMSHSPLNVPVSSLPFTSTNTSCTKLH